MSENVLQSRGQEQRRADRRGRVGYGNGMCVEVAQNQIAAFDTDGDEELVASKLAESTQRGAFGISFALICGRVLCISAV